MQREVQIMHHLKGHENITYLQVGRAGWGRRTSGGRAAALAGPPVCRGGARAQPSLAGVRRCRARTRTGRRCTWSWTSAPGGSCLTGGRPTRMAQQPQSHTVGSVSSPGVAGVAGPGLVPAMQAGGAVDGSRYAALPRLLASCPPRPAFHLPVCTATPPRIVAKGSYSERDAAALIRDIVRVVAHCHSMGVMHRWGKRPCWCSDPGIKVEQALPSRSRQGVPRRVPPPPTPAYPPALGHRRDLKPENFLLESKSDDALIKCTDFGLSVFYKPGQKFKEVVGSGEGRCQGALPGAAPQ